jgi:hypothetical protein
MPHMPESDVTFDTPWAGPGTARMNVMVGPVIPTIQSVEIRRHIRYLPIRLLTC